MIDHSVSTNNSLADLRVPLTADWIAATSNLFESLDGFHGLVWILGANASMYVQLVTQTSYRVHTSLRLGGWLFKEQDSWYTRVARGHLHTLKKKKSLTTSYVRDLCEANPPYSLGSIKN